MYDNALPSGNQFVLGWLRRLGELGGEKTYHHAVRSRLAGLWPNVLKYPSSFAGWGRLGLLLSQPARVLVITGKGAEAAAAQVQTQYYPDLAIVATETERHTFSLTKDRYLSGGKLQFYLCEGQSCSLPVGALEQVLLPNYGVEELGRTKI
ncbi:MAG: hypothetical protein HC821_00370 [Lewinella sp.]|nr:hypothetical protein [Lewinella sp.]